MKKLALSLAVLMGLLDLLHAAPALAINAVSYMSSTGVDVAACTYAQPCSDFKQALSQTVFAGQIICLDQGPFTESSTVIITQSVTIDCEVARARLISLSGGSAITVQAGAYDVVVLRGLDVDGHVGTSQGIWFHTGAALHIEKCVIHDFNGFSSPTAGIFFPHAQSGTMELFVSDTVVRHNNASANGSGIHISPSVNDTISKVVLNHVEVRGNFMGIRADGNWPNVAGGVVNMTVRDSVASGNAANGIVGTSNSTGPTIVMTVVNSASSHNGQGYGVIADGPKTLVKMSRTTASGNNVGIGASNGGQLLSAGNNEVFWNSTDGSPTGVASLK